ncbi:MAG: hypothetical protein MJ186_06445 [Clostridia bacterium]|nr:hypothetical protein [Clostridia bacterium]
MNFGNFGGFGGGMPDMSSIMKIKQSWDSFCAAHPKFPGFLSSVRAKGFCEGQEIAIAIRYPDGTEYKTGIRVKESDLALLDTLKNMGR